MYLYIETIETCTRLLKLRPFLITGNGMLLKYVKGATRARFHQWMRGPMARRLTTNQEILGSIPSVFIFVLSRHGVRLLLLVCADYLLVVALKENFFWWLGKNTDTVVGCSCLRNSARPLKPDMMRQRNLGHCACEWSINSSKYLSS
jgi:hypothetical protein